MTSEHYRQLGEVNQTIDESSAVESAFRTARDQLDEALSVLRRYRAETGMQGRTADALDRWIAHLENRLLEQQEKVERIDAAHRAGREAIDLAKHRFSKLSPVLVSPFEEAHVQEQGSVSIGGQDMPGGEYLATVRAEREADRERASREALEEFRLGIKKAAEQLRLPLESEDQRSSDGRDESTLGPRRAAGTWNPSAGSVMTSSPARGLSDAGSSPISHGSAAQPGNPIPPVGDPAVAGPGTGAHHPPAHLMPRPGVPVPHVPGAGGGVGHPPISTLPMNPHVTPDGEVGGYLPAPVTDVDDPRWSPSYRPSPEVMSSLAVGGIAAGGAAMTVGAVASARAGGMPMIVPSAAPVGPPDLARRAAGLPGYPNAAQGADLRGGGAGGWGRPGEGAGQGAAAGRGAAGAAAAGRPGAPGTTTGPMGMAGTGAPAGREEERQRTRKRYHVPKLEVPPQEEFRTSQHPALGAGSVAQWEQEKKR